MAIGARIIKTEDVKVETNSTPFEITNPHYSFDDIILNENSFSQIMDALSLAENYDLLFSDWGFEETHKNQKKTGINLYGPPGTGKTMAAHAIANHLNRCLLIVNYAEIESKYVGETSKNLTNAFKTANEKGAILFFDEADAILSKRVSEMRHSTDVSVNQTRSVMLMLLNNHEDIVLFATNFIQNFDQAFMRRISSHVFMGLPDEKGRAKIIRKLLPSKLPHKLDIHKISDKYSGISGSDISNTIMLSALHMARNGLRFLSNELFETKLEAIIHAKTKNETTNYQFEDRIVSDEYVRKQLPSSLIEGSEK